MRTWSAPGEAGVFINLWEINLLALPERSQNNRVLVSGNHSGQYAPV
ncbi:hypothetical protein SAMN05216403_11438 [Nitrosospira multiformis ATCC 25196]|uniref:Uncharacterized protein n=1 Tax=Nitrosospira multiformis (strain ATCC 25196 / NCIMB 11849 / C 71) TaxID=323848 RepID=A0A1H5VTQ2_NITMU|nr:hypothetical protein SAMN05216403_11438 [Nitrosospira multiformis ATCC 25196]